MPSSMPAAHRGFCEISLPALPFSSRAKGMEILVFVFIFISLAQHGDAHGPDSCNHGGGLCRVGDCVSGEYLAQFCFEPVILCCKNLSLVTTES
ncbi:gallinacin-12-like [Sylvia atricapilla]|uniref:gallinacin-12-like n=1 Tax=Sylvia atricapilla TaxID=48155 RepID=UPI0033954925